MRRIVILGLSLVLSAAVAVAQGRAGDFPSQPLRLIIGVSSVEELIAVARSKPGELTYASVGPGTTPHLATELFSVRAKIKLVHVPYQGSPPAVTDLLAARVSMMLGVASTIMPQ